MHRQAGSFEAEERDDILHVRSFYVLSAQTRRVQTPYVLT